ncbi:hypothetical protein JFU49_16570 [Pseudomonas sp. TH03]|uniref:hypothetical protein n=1 Tax=Pseudomonas sp. TH03 TaxID=2796369 RepID=UPI001912915E|nr:hypothetical protein [Pseudomonas sp. TH03]MBK5551876.1 hypothetical protein [Pseudomonas sp. TH03]
MVDHDPLEELRPHSAQADDVLDALTQELKIELARVERERAGAAEVRKELLIDSLAIQRAKAALNMLDRYEPGQRHGLAVGMLGALDIVLATIGSNEVFTRHRKLLIELIADLREQRRKARALMVRAMRAVFNIPLFLDGPELSGFRHRLR